MVTPIVEDTLVIWLQGWDSSQEFFNHISILRPTIKFTMEVETDSAIQFLDVLVIRKWSTLGTRSTENPQNTDRYLNFQTNHPPRVKTGVAQSLYHRATIICQEQPDRSDETDTLRHVLQPQCLSHRVSWFSYQQIQEKCSPEKGGSTTRFYIYTLHKRWFCPV
jgi:hypothetical protein